MDGHRLEGKRRQEQVVHKAHGLEHRTPWCARIDRSYQDLARLEHRRCF